MWGLKEVQLSAYPKGEPRDMGTTPKNFFLRVEVEGLWFAYCVPFADPSVPDAEPLDPSQLSGEFNQWLDLHRETGEDARSRRRGLRPPNVFEQHPERFDMSAEGAPLPRRGDEGGR